MRQEAICEQNWSEIAAREPRSILLERAFSRDRFGRSLLFRNPKRVIEARHPGEVRRRFAEIEAALGQRLWVAGYVTYEAGYAFEPSLVELCRPLPDGSPLLWLGCYEGPEIREDSGVRKVSSFVTSSAEFQCSLVPDAYARKVEAIRTLIARGETYQANLTMDVHWMTSEDPSSIYERLLQAQPVRYAAL